eukprot:6205438-Pleurochrysis_carterae.AAC.1
MLHRLSNYIYAAKCDVCDALLAKTPKISCAFRVPNFVLTSAVLRVRPSSSCDAKFEGGESTRAIKARVLDPAPVDPTELLHVYIKQC